MNNLQNELNKWCEKHGMKPQKRSRKDKKAQEAFSEFEIKELMGMNRRTYGRRRGALRQK